MKCRRDIWIFPGESLVHHDDSQALSDPGAEAEGAGGGEAAGPEEVAGVILVVHRSNYRQIN